MDSKDIVVKTVTLAQAKHIQQGTEQRLESKNRLIYMVT